MSEGTPIESRIDILADFWITYKDNPEFKDFIQYNDLGLPLAYAISSGIISESPVANGFVNETFDLLLEAMEVPDDGFETLDDLIIRYGQ
jgi:hypothetical protein